MKHRARLITTREGKFVNLQDMIAAVKDDAFVNEKLVPLLKVGHDRGDSVTQIVRIVAAELILQTSGERIAE